MSVGRRRVLAAALSFAVPGGLVLLGGHRGVHAARSLLFPGAGLVEERTGLAVLLVAAGVLATVAWLRWGVDWLLVLVVAVAAAVSAAATPPGHRVSSVVRVTPSAHEFPLVMLVFSALAWLRSITRRVPGLSRLAARRARRRVSHGLADVARLGLTDRSRCAALVLLAGAAVPDEAACAVVAAGTGPEVVRRATRVGTWARGRRGGDPLRVDHAHLRAVLVLAAPDDRDAVARLAGDAARATVGVPASEPTWVRPLDAVLVALALDRAGEGTAAERCRALFAGPWALRRGHRPAWLWTPLALTAGRSPAWEHAASTALARAAGWVGADDWAALRRSVLGAAARGTALADDERLIAAGRVWLAFVDDPEASRIVARPTVADDPIAVALDALARSLSERPELLRGAPV